MPNPFKSRVYLHAILADFQKAIQRLDQLAILNTEKAAEKRRLAEVELAEAAALEQEAQQAVKTAASIDRLLQG